MTRASTMPTRHDEAFRYSDLDALAPLWPVAVERIVLAPGERRTMTLVETGAAGAARALAVVLGAGAEFDLRILNANRAYGRIAVHAELSESAAFTLGAAQLAGAGQVLELVTTVVHAGPDAASRQTVRSIAAAGSVVNYLGKVVVAKGADGTDAEQSVRAMLLDRQSAANAKPELEIHADDVKCAHGCAVGELDANALFYMAQRGLPPEAAKRLMLQAFIAEAWADEADGDGSPEAQARALAALEAML